MQCAAPPIMAKYHPLPTITLLQKKGRKTAKTSTVYKINWKGSNYNDALAEFCLLIAKPGNELECGIYGG